MVTYLKGDPGGSSRRWESGREDSPALTGDILQESAQDMIELIRSGVHPISEDHPVRTTNFYVMGAWKQAVFMSISYCHCRVATPPSPDSEPSSSATPTFPVCHPDMWFAQVSLEEWHEAIQRALSLAVGRWSATAIRQAVQSLVDIITAGGAQADEWNVRVAAHGNDACSLVRCACEWLAEETME
eukprot:1377235-Rhodomonas_salina.2